MPQNGVRFDGPNFSFHDLADAVVEHARDACSEVFQQGKFPFACTRHREHTGAHAAAITDGSVVAIWEDV